MLRDPGRSESRDNSRVPSAGVKPLARPRPLPRSSCFQKHPVISPPLITESSCPTCYFCRLPAGTFLTIENFAVETMLSRNATPMHCQTECFQGSILTEKKSIGGRFIIRLEVKQLPEEMWNKASYITAGDREQLDSLVCLFATAREFLGV